MKSEPKLRNDRRIRGLQNGFENLEARQLLTATTEWVEQTSQSTSNDESPSSSLAYAKNRTYMLGFQQDGSGTATAVVTSHDASGNDSVLATHPSSPTTRYLASYRKLIDTNGSDVFWVLDGFDTSGAVPTRFLNFNSDSGASQIVPIDRSIAITSITVHDDFVIVGGRKGGGAPGSGAYAAKYQFANSRFELEWESTFISGGQYNNDAIRVLDTNANGDVFVAGSTGGLRPGTHDAFVARLDGKSGALKWAEAIASTDTDLPNDIVVSSSKVITVGATVGSLDGTPHTPGHMDGFIVQFDMAGGSRELSQFGASMGGSVRPEGLVLDANENLLIAGTTRSSDLVNPGSPSVLQGVFLGEFDAGTLENSWYVELDSLAHDTATDITVDGDMIYVSGSTQDTLNGSPNRGQTDSFLAKFRRIDREPVTFGTPVACESDGSLQGQHSNALIVDGALVSAAPNAAEAIRVVKEETSEDIYVRYGLLGAPGRWYGPYDGTNIDQVQVLARGGNDEVAIDIGVPNTGFSRANVGIGGPVNEMRSVVVFGGDGDDLLIGGGENDCIYGENGSDNLMGRQGDDWLSAGEEDDIVWGNAGDDTIAGGWGNDFLNGGSGADFINGDEMSTSSPVIPTAKTADDRIFGNSGIDDLFGNVGDDEIFGGSGDDTIDGWFGNDTIHGEKGHDTLRGHANIDRIRGGDGHDVLIGGSQDDNLKGEAGNDRLEGGSGDDYLDGGLGLDWLIGDDFLDSPHPDAYGDDILIGGRNDDIDGHDALYAGYGSDQLFGGPGQDVMVGDFEIRDASLPVPGGLPANMPTVINHNDLICGGQDADFILGGHDTDLLYGEGGDETGIRLTTNYNVQGILGDGRNYVDSQGRQISVPVRQGSDHIDGGPGNNTFDGNGTDVGPNTFVRGTGINASPLGTSRTIVVQGTSINSPPNSRGNCPLGAPVRAKVNRPRSELIPLASQALSFSGLSGQLTGDEFVEYGFRMENVGRMSVEEVGGNLVENVDGTPEGTSVALKYQNHADPLTIVFEETVSAVGGFVGTGVEGKDHVITVEVYGAADELIRTLEVPLELGEDTDNMEGSFFVETPGGDPITRATIRNNNPEDFGNALILVDVMVKRRWDASPVHPLDYTGDGNVDGADLEALRLRIDDDHDGAVPLLLHAELEALDDILNPNEIEVAECDFDLNGTCDRSDVDVLKTNIETAATDPLRFHPRYDLNEDGLLGNRDVDAWLALAEAGVQTFNRADFDLDGVVGFTDFLVLSSNFGQNGRRTDGDADDDGIINFSDFLVLSANFGISSAG